MAGLKVQFGRREYEIQPQRIGRIRRKLGDAASVLQTAAVGEAPEGIGEQLYEGLKVFVPDLAPMWELAGYMSEEDYERRDDPAFEEQPYDPDRDGSPLTSEIEELLTAIFTVNGGDRLVRLLGKVIDPSMIQRQLRIAQTRAVMRSASNDSPNSPPQSGGSDRTSSSETTPTSEPISA